MDHVLILLFFLKVLIFFNCAVPIAEQSNFITKNIYKQTVKCTWKQFIFIFNCMYGYFRLVELSNKTIQLYDVGLFMFFGIRFVFIFGNTTFSTDL